MRPAYEVQGGRRSAGLAAVGGHEVDGVADGGRRPCTGRQVAEGRARHHVRGRQGGVQEQNELGTDTCLHRLHDVLVRDDRRQ